MSALEPQAGVVISRAELQGRWFYSELTSSRLGPAHSARGIDPGILAAAMRGEPFHRLGEAWQTSLTDLGPTVTNQLIRNLDYFQHYECQVLSREQLGHLWVVPALDPERNSKSQNQLESVPFTRYLACPVPVGSGGQPDPDDPRTVADNVPISQPFPLIYEPPILLPVNGHLMIIDGTTRMVIFARSPDTGRKLLVWTPKSSASEQ